MSDTTDKNTTSGNVVKDANTQLADLLTQTKKVIQEIDETNKVANDEMDKVGANVDKTIADLENICSDLDQTEKVAGDELDKIILEQAEDSVDVAV